ncbi:hypothetical protein Dimus_007558, partial [Dionaea muscipula]
KKNGVAVVRETQEGASVIGPRRVLPSQREKAMGCSVDKKRPRDVVSQNQTPKVDTYREEKKDTVTIVGETQKWNGTWAVKQRHASNLMNKEPRDPISNMGIDDCNKRPSLREQLHNFINFLQSDVEQSSYDPTSCVTTTSVHATSAPMLNSTTNCSSRQGTASCAAVGSSTDAKLIILIF